MGFKNVLNPIKESFKSLKKLRNDNYLEILEIKYLPKLVNFNS